MNNKFEQAEFISDLIEMLKDIGQKGIPEWWNGIELRWWIAERFGQVVIKGTGSKKRKSEYNDEAHQRRHQQRPEAKFAAQVYGFSDVFTLIAQLPKKSDEDNAVLNRDAEKYNERDGSRH